MASLTKSDELTEELIDEVLDEDIDGYIDDVDISLSPTADSIVYSELTADDMTSDALFEKLAAITDASERTKAEEKVRTQARLLKCVSTFNNCYKAFTKKLAKAAALESTANCTRFDGQPLMVCCGEWVADNGGVYRMKAGGDGSIRREDASPIPIMPIARLKNVDSGIEKLEIAFKAGRRWQSFISERAVLASRSRIVELANNGIEVNTENSNLLVKYIADCVASSGEVIPRHESVSRLGWTPEGFVPYCASIRFDGERENKYLFDAVAESGDFDVWKEETLKLRENKVLRLAMAASFASVLIEKCGVLPFVFHLWGGTGVGKSVTLMVAASIWGNPEQGKLMRTMNMTQNAMMDAAAFLRNLPFFGDELQTIKTAWDNYDKLIMCLAEGTERGRMSYDKANAVRSWKNVFLFSGEEPVTKPNSGGGVKNRVIEIGCDLPIIENGNEAVAVVCANYGHAGRAYTDAIQAIGNAGIKAVYKACVTDIMSAVDTTEKQAMAGALLLTADRLAVKYIYGGVETRLETNDINEYLTTVAEIDAAERAYQYVLNLIARNPNRFDATEAGEFWGRVYVDNALINNDVLNRELASAGFEFEAVKRKWADKGYLITNSAGRYQHYTKVNNVKAAYIKLVLPQSEEQKSDMSVKSLS